MNNSQFWESFKALDPHENRNHEELFCDKMVREGLGQTCGGYLDDNPVNKENAEPSQQCHFQDYYIMTSKADNNPTYTALKCPQLIMYIAELAGLKKEHLQDAYDFLHEVESEKGLIKSNNKNGNYLESIKEGKYLENIKDKEYLKYIKAENKSALTIFKDKLRMVDVNKILRQSQSIEDAIKKIKDL